jgi:hypothetical protein
MFIKINNSIKSCLTITENYSEYEKDDLISILSDVCEQIDDLKLAFFVIQFSPSDNSFDHKVDFGYDFTSIANELQDLKIFLKESNGEFILNFYELNKSVVFTFIENKIRIKIIKSDDLIELNEVIVLHKDLQERINNILLSFTMILEKYFPIAYKKFKTQKYVIE